LARIFLVLFLLGLLGIGALWWGGGRLQEEISSGLIEQTIVRLVREKLGLEIELGAIRVATFPVVSIESVKVRGASEDMISLGALRVRLDVSDYLSGRLAIEEIRLVRPELNLVRDAQGQLNIKQVVATVKAHREKLRLAARSPQEVALEELQEETEELGKDLPPMPERRKKKIHPSPPTAPVSPAPVTSPPESTTLNQGPVVLRNFVIEDARLRFEDRSLGPEPFRAALESFSLQVRLPEKPGAPLDVTLDAKLLGAPLHVSATIDPLRRKGPVRFSLAGLPLGTIQPYLARKIPLPLDLGEIPLHIQGQLELDGKPTHYQVEVRIPESRIRIEKDGRALSLAFSLDTEVTPDHLELRGLKLNLAEGLGLELTGNVRDFKDPRFQIGLRSTNFDLPSLLDLLPAEKAQRLKDLELQIGLGLDVKLEGRVKDPGSLRPDVSLELGPASVTLKLAEEPLEIDLPKFWVRLDQDQLSLRGLEVRAAGVKILEAGLQITDWKRLPQIETQVVLPKISMEELLKALPGKIPLRTENARKGFAKAQDLDLTGSLGLSLGTTVSLAVLPELKTFRKVHKLPELIATFKQNKTALLADWKRPERLQELLDLGLLDLGVDLDLKGFQAIIHKNAFEAPVNLDVAVHVDPQGVDLRKIRVRGLGAEVSLRGSLRNPLQGKDLEVSAHLGSSDNRPLELAEVLTHLPEALQEKLSRFSPQGSLEASIGARGPVTSPEVIANLALRDLQAEVVTPGGPTAKVVLPQLEVRLQDMDLRIPTCEIQTPLGSIRVIAKVEDLKGDKRFRVRIATPGSGLDLLKALPFLPNEKRQKLEARKLERVELDLQLDASGTPEKPEASLLAELHLPTSKLRLNAVATDLRGNKDVSFSLKTGPGGIRLDKLAARLPPELQAKIRAPLTGGISLELKGGGSLAHPEGLAARAKVDLSLPGGNVKLRAKIEDPKGEKRFASKLVVDFSKLTEVFAFLPPATREKLVRLSPAAQVGLTIEARGTPKKIRAHLVAGLKHASLRVPVREKIMPVFLEPATIQAKIDITPKQGARPEISARAAAKVQVLLQHPEKGTIPISLDLSNVRYDGKDLDIGKLAIRTLGQPVDVSGHIRDLKGAKELDLTAKLLLNIQQLVQRLVPPEAEIRSNGSLAVDARIEGTVVRPLWKADLTLRNFFLDAYKLKGIPVSIADLQLHATDKDLILDPFQLAMGGNKNTFFLHGSLLKILQGDPAFAKATSFWKAMKQDRDKAVDRLVKVVKSKGGKKAVVQMVGNETLLRILGSSSHKIFVHVESRELARPFTFKTLLTGVESQEFDFRKEEIVAKYRQIAMDQVRAKLGTSERLFGKKHALIIPIREAFAVVLDRGFNMVYPRKIPFWRLVTTPTKF
jgi:hypothetical protein